jgi:putative aldouronate transport system permease protein
LKTRSLVPIFPILNHLFFSVLCVFFLLPLWAIIAISISNEGDIVNFGYSLIPKTLDFGAYRYLFEKPLVILNAYKVTIIMSVFGTLLSLIMLSMCAYALSRKDFAYRKFITFYLFFTMLFNGGLVPFYILMTKYMHMQNTYAALIIPLLAPVWYLLIMRTFFQQLPAALIESATIDGAKEWRIYLSIILPLSKPVLATIGLMQLLMYWNSWFQALLFVSAKDMYPLQYLLQVTLNNLEEILRNMSLNLGMNVSQTATIPSENIRMAMAILAIGPMLILYPFFQKYFAKGMTIGSVKE